MPIVTADIIYGFKDKVILGVNPPVLDFAWFDLWAKPLGLLNVLGYFYEQGNQVHLIDSVYQARETPIKYGRHKVKKIEVGKPDIFKNVPRRFYRFGLTPDEFNAAVDAVPKPDIILVSSIMTYWYLGVFESIALLRKRFPGTPIALGGIYAALCHEHAAQSGADFLLLDPVPQRPARLPAGLYQDLQHALIVSAYGCPKRCDYCASSQINPHFQPRSVADIFADLCSQIEQHPEIKDAAFYDDALLWNKEKVLYPLCDLLRNHYPDMRLHTPNGLSAALMDAHSCRILYQSGFKTIRLSLEGTDAHTRRLSSNKVDQNEYERALNNLIKAGYNLDSLETYVLAGLPGQELKHIEQSIMFVKSFGAKVKLCEFSPIPGTKAFIEAARRAPIILEEPLWHNNSVYVPYLSGQISPEEFKELKIMAK